MFGIAPAALIYTRLQGAATYAGSGSLLLVACCVFFVSAAAVRLAIGLTKTSVDAEEVVQETFLSMFRRLRVITSYSIHYTKLYDGFLGRRFKCIGACV